MMTPPPPGRRLEDRPDEMSWVGRRATDPPPERQSMWFRAGLIARQQPILISFTIALIVCALPMIMVLLESQHRTTAIQEQRLESTTLLCDLNGVMIGVLEANPGAPGGAEAIMKLRGQRCADVVNQIRRDLGEPTVTPTP